MAEDEDELPELDYADPLKRRPDDEDDDVGGLDPAITIPPED
jgi:hypothetical protein